MRGVTFTVGIIVLLAACFIPVGCQWLEAESDDWIKYPAMLRDEGPTGIQVTAACLFALLAFAGKTAISTATRRDG